jgi:hypothetical protein
MEEEHSKFWRLALILSLAAFVAVAYLRIPPFRDLVNEKFPWVKEELVHRGIKIVNHPSEAYAEPTPEAAATPQSAPKPAPALEQIVANRALWPKEVILKKQTIFPAVVNGKEVGKITLPAGITVQIYKIEPDRVAVIYKGGGAWVQVAETDLLERVRASQR